MRYSSREPETTLPGAASAHHARRGLDVVALKSLPSVPEAATRPPTHMKNAASCVVSPPKHASSPPASSVESNEPPPTSSTVSPAKVCREPGDAISSHSSGESAKRGAPTSERPRQHAHGRAAQDRQIEVHRVRGRFALPARATCRATRASAPPIGVGRCSVASWPVQSRTRRGVQLITIRRCVVRAGARQRRPARVDREEHAGGQRASPRTWTLKGRRLSVRCSHRATRSSPTSPFQAGRAGSTVTIASRARQSGAGGARLQLPAEIPGAAPFP